MTNLEKIKKKLDLTDDEINSHETDLYVKHTMEREQHFIDNNINYSNFTELNTKTKWIELTFFLLDDKINRSKQKRSAKNANS